MAYILLALNSILMVIIPIAAAIIIRRKTGAGWRLFFIGAATFIFSQILHIPFNWLVGKTGLLPTDLSIGMNLLIVAVFLGLSAGVFEEGSRYLAYRFWAKDARSWSRGMMLGAGHGGIEAILLGLILLINNFSLLMVANNATLMSTIPAGQQATIMSTAQQILQLPWYGVLLGAVERLFAVIAHLAMSVLVLQAFLRGSIRWLFLSIGFHGMLNAVAVIVAQRWGNYAAEGAMALITILSLFIIFRLRTPEPVGHEPEPSPLSDAEPLALQPTDEIIDRSRYNG